MQRELVVTRRREAPPSSTGCGERTVLPLCSPYRFDGVGWHHVHQLSLLSYCCSPVLPFLVPRGAGAYSDKGRPHVDGC